VAFMEARFLPSGVFGPVDFVVFMDVFLAHTFSMLAGKSGVLKRLGSVVSAASL
jgi:hypothetical protein